MGDLLDNRLYNKFKKEEEKKTAPKYNDDEDEETYLYDVRKPMAFINEGANGVFDITRQTGLNSAKNVFDKGAVFKTTT